MNRIKTATLGSLLAILIAASGCALPRQPSPAASQPAGAAPATETPSPKEAKSELDQAVDQAAAQARATLHSYKTKHQELLIEATPMWSFNYQGEVHIRVYGADGQLLRDEFRK